MYDQRFSLLSWQRTQKCAGRRGAGKVAENSTSGQAGRREVKRYWTGLELLRFHTYHQRHTSSNKATPTLNKATPSVGTTLYLSMWAIFIETTTGKTGFTWLTSHGSSSREAQAGTPSRNLEELKQRPRRGIAYWLDFHISASLLFNTIQDQLPSDSIIHSGLVILHESLIKKIPPLTDGSIFLN